MFWACAVAQTNIVAATSAMILFILGPPVKVD
jgi:hypothetical protein